MEVDPKADPACCCLGDGSKEKDRDRSEKNQGVVLYHQKLKILEMFNSNLIGKSKIKSNEAYMGILSLPKDLSFLHPPCNQDPYNIFPRICNFCTAFLMSFARLPLLLWDSCFKDDEATRLEL